MKKFTAKSTCAMLAIVQIGLWLGSSARADNPTHAVGPVATPVQDGVLLNQDVLLGQVVDPSGRPAAGQSVTVRQNGRVIVAHRAARDGRFAVAGLRPGVYQISTSSAVTSVRLWTPELAPPVAESEVLVVHGGPLVSGPLERASWIQVLGNPWLMGGIAVGAVAVPVALAERDDSPSAEVPDAS
jgi:hypothetical protein